MIDDIRTLIIAHDMLSRMGLSALLQSHEAVQVVGQLATSALSASALEVYRPDVIVWLLGDDAPSASLLADITQPMVFLVGDMPHATRLLSVMRPMLADIAVWGMLAQDGLSVDKLVSTIRAVCDGLVTLDPTLLPALVLSQQTEADVSSATDALTPREMQVLQHMAEGLPNKQIARALGISPNTVKFHVNAILSKLDAQSRTEAVIRATQLGWVLL